MSETPLNQWPPPTIKEWIQNHGVPTGKLLAELEFWTQQVRQDEARGREDNWMCPSCKAITHVEDFGRIVAMHKVPHSENWCSASQRDPAAVVLEAQRMEERRREEAKIAARPQVICPRCNGVLTLDPDFRIPHHVWPTMYDTKCMASGKKFAIIEAAEQNDEDKRILKRLAQLMNSR